MPSRSSESQADIKVVGDAGDGSEAVTLAATLRPDVVLMDVRMPRMDGIEATRRIVAAGTTPYILVLTTFDLDEYVSPPGAAAPAGSSSRTRPRRTCSPRSGPWPPAMRWWRPP